MSTQKYHVNDNGEVGLCSAKQGRCPFGGSDEHFANQQEAMHYADDLNHGELYYEKLLTLNKKEVMKEFGVSNAEVTEFNVLLDKVKRNGVSDIARVSAYTRSSAMSTAKNKQINELISQVLPGHTRNAVNLIVEDLDSYYIWTNSSKQRDVIKLYKGDRLKPIATLNKNTKFSTITEVKDLTNNAQLSASELNTSQTIGLTSKDNKAVTKKISTSLSQYDPRIHAYSNYEIGLTRDETENYLLDDYYNQNCNEIVFYSDKQKKNIFVPITEEDKLNGYSKARQILKDNNIKIGVHVRQNNSANSKSMTKSDKERFLEDYGVMFKDGVAKEKFTIKDLESQPERTYNGIPSKAYVRQYKVYEPTYIDKGSKRDKTFIRMGEFYINLDDNKIDEDREFSIDEFRLFKPVLTGSISEK